MKRWFSLCAFLICQLMLLAQAGSSEDGFNPDTPPNPEMPRPKFTLTVNSLPQQGGSLNRSGSATYTAGTKLWMGAYPNNGYVFERWQENGQTISTSSSFYYEMPERDALLTAEFRFDPTTPPNPEQPKEKHLMTLVSQPQQAGYFNWSDMSEVVENERVYIVAYNRNSSFKFVDWQLDGQTVSTNAWYEFEMPDHDITLVAHYDFDPTPPKNPGRNYFNAETGEVILTDFTEGNIWEALYQLVGDNRESVTMITIVGHTNNGDWSVARDYPNLTLLDLSRTNGTTVVPDWTFENCSQLTDLLLPSSIEQIGWYAFSGCSNLQSLTVYASTPPVVTSTSFTGLSDGLVVYVPALSVGLYQAADGWSQFNIQPLREQVSELTVNLPGNTDVSLYKDMYIELLNKQNGQRQRYLINGERTSYTFSNLIHNTSYTVYLKNGQGMILGQIDDVEIIEEDKVVWFDSLLIPRDVEVKVLTPNGDDITAQTTITWFDQDGTYLNRGNRLSLQLEGVTVRYRIALPQEFGMQYLIPSEQEYVIGEQNDITYTLAAIANKMISGSVIDLQTDQPIIGATVSVSQTINGLYSVSSTAQTDDQGRWAIEVKEAKTEVTASKVNYISQNKSFDTLPNEDINFSLKDINGTKINLTLTYTDVNGQTHSGYADSLNVAYAVTNVTTGEPVTGISVQYPQIVLTENLTEGTLLRITATSKKQKFMPVETEAQVDEFDRVNMTLPIKQLGAIRASYSSTDNISVVGILYDQDGKLVQKYDYTGDSLYVGELFDGNYTLVNMAGSQFFNSIFSLAQFAEQGLRDGIDYVKNSCTVTSAEITTVTNRVIPYLDETKLYYTSNKASFTVNKSQVTVGQYLTLSAFLDFKSVYANRVSDVKLIVDLPQTASFVAGSVMIGNNVGSYTCSDQTVVVPMESLADRIRFCIIPTAGGTFSASASVQFTLDGKTITQPIGSVTYVAKDLSITVPAVVASKKVPVSGSAVGKSTVKIYADNLLLGQTIALANGVWATTIELIEPENLSTHAVYAVITTPTGIEMQSETQMVTYDETVPQVANVIMYYTNPEENWWSGRNYELVHDFLSPSVTPLRYTYYIYNRSFTFAINFSGDVVDRLANVILEVKTGDGRWNPLAAKYDKPKGAWLAYGEFGNMYDGIVPVNVRVRFECGSEEIVVVYPGPDADVPIDPSGYVYEAVPSNRLQGVTASIYYKELVEDVYGDKHENVVLWNAEEYAQENPLFTDENGMYRWDVPQGLWQVKFEKEGYQTAYSEWLPVPPPQLDVNIAMTQLLQPNVKKVSAFDEGFELEFDKYMDPATLTLENIVLTRNGEPVEGMIELLNEETIGEGQTQTYASKLNFNLAGEDKLQYTDELMLTVTRKVKSYAGVPLADEFTQQLSVAPKVRKILSDSLINVVYGETRTMKVAASPAEAAQGKTLRVRSLSQMIAKPSVFEVMLDENGETEVTITGGLPGATVLTFTIDDTDVSGHTTVNVKEKELLKTVPPMASRVSGTQVYRGTKILLSCETENAEIYYTLDGTEPLNTSSTIKYDEASPIVIADDNVKIKAVAIGHDMSASEVSVFEYALKKTSCSYHLPKGWSWISHNLDLPVSISQFDTAFESVIGQSASEVEELQPLATYKVKLTEPAETHLSGVEFNASAPLMLEAGWNWIGYPLNQTMTLKDALQFYDAAEGDMIVGQDGFAQYVDSEWKGTLQYMEPGKGYLFKSVTANELLFNTLASLPANSRRIRRSNAAEQSVDVNAYPDIMPLTAQLYGNGEAIDANQYVIVAYCDNVCRGVSQCQENRLLMNIYGHTDEEIKFTAYRRSDNKEFEVNENLKLSSDNVGTWKAPYILNMVDQATGVEMMNSDFSVTPLVAQDKITVNAGGRTITNLSIVNMSGQAVLSISDFGKGGTIDVGQLLEGMYILTVQAEGQTYYKKIVIVSM